MHFLDQIGGHLARTETRHAHLRRDLLHLGFDPLRDFTGGDGQRISAFEALIGGLGDLHAVGTFRVLNA